MNNSKVPADRDSTEISSWPLACGVFRAMVGVMRVMIAGCGYIGMALGRALLKEGHEVFGMRRPSPLAEESLCEEGIVPLLGDITRPETLPPLVASLDIVVNCVAPQGGGVNAYLSTYFDGTRNLLHWLESHSPQAFIYTSSTGVYGEDDGSMVTEQSACEPPTETGRVLLQTEALLLSEFQAARLAPIILRLAGIYGPGRGYWLKRLLNGDAILPEEDSRILNMIHQQDVVSAIFAAIEGGRAGEVYNVVDDAPVTVKEMRTHEALTSYLPARAPLGDTPGSKPARPRATNKRVSNAKLKSATGWKPKYPSFREGFLQELENRK